MADSKTKWPRPFHRPIIKFIEWLLAIICLTSILIFLLAPQQHPAKTIPGEDLIFVLDVSSSMLITEPHQKVMRLEEAKSAIKRFVQNQPPTRLGLVLVSGSAFWAMPLSTSAVTFEQYLSSAEPIAFSNTGSQLGAALNLLASHFCPEKNRPCDISRPTTVAVVSDGEFFDHLVTPTLKELHKGGLNFIFIGVGHESGQVPSLNYLGEITGSRINNDGSPIMSKPRPDVMKKLAQISNGEYRHASEISKLGRIIPKPKITSNIWKSDLWLIVTWLTSFVWLLVIRRNP